MVVSNFFILILNWGFLAGVQMLTLESQELGAIVALKEERAIIKMAIRKVQFANASPNLNSWF